MLSKPSLISLTTLRYNPLEHFVVVSARQRGRKGEGPNCIECGVAKVHVEGSGGLPQSADLSGSCRSGSEIL